MDLSSVKSSGIHLRAISQETPQPPVTKISFDITYLKFNSNVPGVNGLIAMYRFHNAYQDCSIKHFICLQFRKNRCAQYCPEHNWDHINYSRRKEIFVYMPVTVQLDIPNGIYFLWKHTVLFLSLGPFINCNTFYNLIISKNQFLFISI